MSILNPEGCCIPRRHRLLGQTTKQPLSNLELRKPWKYKKFEGWSLTLVAYKKMYNLTKRLKPAIAKKLSLIMNLKNTNWSNKLFNHIQIQNNHF